MNFKTYWFGQSLAWIGVLYSSSACATTETAPSSVSDAVFTEGASSSLEAEHQVAGNSPAIASIAPPEVLPTLERLSPAAPPLKSEGEPAKPFRSFAPNQNPGIPVSEQEIVPHHWRGVGLSTLQSSLAVEDLGDEQDGSPQGIDVPIPQRQTVSEQNSMHQEVQPEPAIEQGDRLGQLTPAVPLEDETTQETEASGGDSELGRLRLRPVELADDVEPTDPELGRLRLRPVELADEATSGDPELGRLRLRETEPVAAADVDTVFLSGRINYLRSDNILLDNFDPVDDQLLRLGASLIALPTLGSQTQLLASVGGNLARYGELSELDYQDLEFRAEIQQQLFPRTYGSLGWSNRQFFSADDGDRFLNDHSIRLSLSRRDPLTSQLTLDSFYQLRLSFADPVDRSRISNTLGAGLSYQLQSDLEVGLDYQLVLTDFTQQDREEAYHQVTAQLSYDLSDSSRVRLFGGFSFGRSSNSAIDFDSSILGIAFDTFLPLF